MAKYRLHNDVVAVIADAYFQKQIPPAKTLFLLNSEPTIAGNLNPRDLDDWNLIVKLIRYHPRLLAARKKTNIKHYVGGSEGVWSDFITNNSEMDLYFARTDIENDPMPIVRSLTMEGQIEPTFGDNIMSSELNHMSHLWQDIETPYQTINYQILKITI
jgi:hypothetical protein